jgi:uncharacterized protein YceK
MGSMIAALVVILIISIFCLWFRAFSTFNLILLGTAMLIAHHISNEELWLQLGAPMLIGGLVILWLTSLQVHGSGKIRYMFNVFLYGFFMFMRLFFIFMIITIPLVGFASIMCRNYREICLVSAGGSYMGTVMVDDNNEDASGKKYKRIDR